MYETLTKDQLEEIRQRAEVATEGFWNADVREWPGNENLRYWINTLEDGLAAAVTKEDAEFIANAHQDIPALLNHINKLEKELEEKEQERKERNSVFIELLSEEVL
ncbi:hypothetical protein [Bacillus inaquosorum]|uniref:hypothetical protein n=1 Tax=Bacillus inaquosorum TaxID=483913 RepID=UPI0022808549|nr:hypothetical protein [Bacillus inaquosorum]MCY8997958.1 hypothetical protein [Bacillus inaquosorum]